MTEAQAKRYSETLDFVVSEDSRLAFTHRNPPEMAQHLCNPACKDLPEDNYPWRVHVNQRTGERRAER